MPILLVLFLGAACSPVAWPAPPLGWGARTATTLMLLALILPLAAHYALAHWAVAKLPLNRNFVSEKYARLRRLIGLAHFGLAIAAIALGWGWVVNTHVQPAPFAELLVPLPFILGVMLTWLVHYDADKALRGRDGPFWSRPGHFLHRLRPFAFLALMPAVVMAAQQTLTRYVPEIGQAEWFQWLLIALTPLLLIVMPLIAKPVLGLQSLPLGPHRTQLEATAQRLNFRCADWLVWPTQQTAVNAMVMGLLPQTRYVVFSDLLLSQFSESELEAVQGHEIGHVRHGHLLYYTLFLILSILLLGLAAEALRLLAVGRGFVTEEESFSWFALPPFVLATGYIFLVFGYLSRQCERQADLFGARAVAANTHEGHPYAAGVYAMTRALEKVAAFNGMENSYGQSDRRVLPRLRQRLFAWTHGTIGDRIDFLFRTLEDETLERRTQHRIRTTHWLIMAALVVALMALSYVLGTTRLLALL